jgi:hypothetical protein
MAHNNIQYSEKYYDDVYEYRCGMRPMSREISSILLLNTITGFCSVLTTLFLAAGMLFYPLRLPSTYPRTGCCPR